MGPMHASWTRRAEREEQFSGHREHATVTHELAVWQDNDRRVGDKLLVPTECRRIDVAEHDSRRENLIAAGRSTILGGVFRFPLPPRNLP